MFILRTIYRYSPTYERVAPFIAGSSTPECAAAAARARASPFAIKSSVFSVSHLTILASAASKRITVHSCQMNIVV